MFKSRRAFAVHMALFIIGAPCLWLFWVQYTSPIGIFDRAPFLIKVMLLIVFVELRRQVYWLIFYFQLNLPRFGLADVGKGMILTVITDTALIFVSVPARLTVFFLVTHISDVRMGVLVQALFWAAFVSITAKPEKKPNFRFLLAKSCLCITDILVYLYTGSLWYAVFSDIWHEFYQNLQIVALEKLEQQLD